MTVGVIDTDGVDERARDAVVDALRDADEHPAVGPIGDLSTSDLDWLVAIGSPALERVAHTPVSVPVLAFDADGGVPSVPSTDCDRALDAVLADEVSTVDRQLLSVTVDGTDAPQVLFDATLVTAEPARISEFTIESQGDTVACVRADGIVLATAAGSTGYAAAAGGPVIAPGSGVVSVVPIAPFVTNAAHWVLPADDVTLTVEREEPVELVLDGREWGPVEEDASVHVSLGDTRTFFTPPGHRPWHARSNEQLEKL